MEDKEKDQMGKFWDYVKQTKTRDNAKQKQKMSEFDDYFTAKYMKDPNFGKVDDLSNFKFKPRFEEERIKHVKEAHEKYEFFGGATVSYFEERLDEISEGIKDLNTPQKQAYKTPLNADRKMVFNVLWSLRFLIGVGVLLFIGVQLVPESPYKKMGEKKKVKSEL